MPDATGPDSRERLIHAASEVFAAQGFEKATVREICHRAQVNIALVKYYFGDKLELYTEVLRAALQATPKPVIVDEPPAAAFRRMVRALIERIAESGDSADLKFRLMVNEFLRPSAATARVVDVVMRPFYDRLRGLLSQISGLPPDHDRVRLCVHGVLGQIAHFSRSGPVVPLLWPGMTMTPQQREMVASHVAESTLAILAMPPGALKRPPKPRIKQVVVKARQSTALRGKLAATPIPGREDVRRS